MRTVLSVLSALLLVACPSKDSDTDDTHVDDSSVDQDGDGFYTPDDCDDSDSAVYPGADEHCDGVDEDCDGDVDEDAVDASSWHEDADDDGFGSAASIVACDAPDGHVADDTDCDDTDPAVHPGATEVCNGDDDDCDTLVDDADPDWDTTSGGLWYVDGDHDGYGVGAVEACAQPPDTSDQGGDCDDADSSVNPGATEVCNAGVDDDCDGDADDLDSSTDLSTGGTWYLDSDGDTWGGLPVDACVQPADTVTTSGDCDDVLAWVNPGATEVCNGTDDDCDGDTDDDDASVDLSTGTTFYVDGDGDLYGDTPVVACDLPAGAVEDGGDCDDVDPAVNPGAVEVCNTVDDDCDGTVDEGVCVGEICGNGVDDDGDGLQDCEDAECIGDPSCVEDCDNGTDDDGDGVADCLDDDCWGLGACDFQARSAITDGDVMMNRQVWQSYYGCYGGSSSYGSTQQHVYGTVSGEVELIPTSRSWSTVASGDVIHCDFAYHANWDHTTFSSSGPIYHSSTGSRSAFVLDSGCPVTTSGFLPPRLQPVDGSPPRWYATTSSSPYSPSGPLWFHGSAVDHSSSWTGDSSPCGYTTWYTTTYGSYVTYTYSSGSNNWSRQFDTWIVDLSRGSQFYAPYPLGG